MNELVLIGLALFVAGAVFERLLGRRWKHLCWVMIHVEFNEVDGVAALRVSGIEVADTGQIQVVYRSFQPPAPTFAEDVIAMIHILLHNDALLEIASRAGATRMEVPTFESVKFKEA
jgi:hypothetical protein